MVTHFAIKGAIAQSQLDVILSMLKSWNIDVDVETEEPPVAATPNISFSAGLWSDYEIDDKSLRAKAWGTHKRIAQ